MSYSEHLANFMRKLVVPAARNANATRASLNAREKLCRQLF